MKKYFITSDIHSFYEPLKTALTKAGFDINNPEHIFVCCGDFFDRGEETKEVFNFIKSIPQDRRILIKGNHELLYNELLNKSFPADYDFSNGTVKTFFTIAGYNEQMLTRHYWYDLAYKTRQDSDLFANRPFETWNEVKNIVSEHPITKWINSSEFKWYWETNNYIFVHSFIPLGFNSIYREDWRNAVTFEWKDAVWGCPWGYAMQGLNKTGKTIVCGHWHTSDFFNHLRNSKKRYDTNNNPIFKSKKYKIIGLDACTALTNKVNILVLNEDEL